ncbi:MAG TPA: EamA family transporter [Polyangiaceae bacterium]|jgi:O-acetylserine/cysteine efflux transporter|nr:EamA family transporter [Polyangiaceae bacterium]
MSQSPSQSSIANANAAVVRRGVNASDWSLFAIALAVTAIWGFNFVVIKVGTEGVPPLLLAALRFVFVALPAVFFVKRPRAPWLLVAGYGLFLGVGEFGLLFSAIKLGAPVGLSSLILQSQAFFTALLASFFLGERFALHSALGLLVASLGLVLIGAQQNRPGAWGGHFTLGLAMLVTAAAMWAAANILARRIGNVGSLNLLIWSSLVSPLPLLLLSFVLEGSRAMLRALGSLSWLSVGALAYLVVLSTLVGYGAWNHLIVKHSASRVAPFSMLVPIFGISSSALFLGEHFSAWHAVAAALVGTGLALDAFGRRRSGAR